MEPYVIEEHMNGVLSFTINRPGKRNAINYEVMAGLEQAMEKAGEEKIKALVVTGSGDQAFCSGGDLSIFHQLQTEEEAYGMLSKMAGILYRLLMLPKPTVALINGTAIGGGCELAAACDFRIASKEAKAGFVQGKLAITTGWGGGTILLEKLPSAKALRMLMGAEHYSAEQLKEIGFVEDIFEGNSLAACFTFLEKKLMLETGVLEAYKRMLIDKWQSGSIQKRIEEEVRRCAVLWESDIHHEKVQHFLNRK